MKQYIRPFLVIVLAAFYGVLSLIHMIYQRWKKGPEFFAKTVHPRPAVLDEGWDHRSIQLSTVKLHYVQCGDESKPLLLFVHGFPEFWYSWRFQMRYFQNDYRVVAIDQRGYNRSEKPESVSAYNVHLLANDVKEVIEKLGYEKAVIAGHDWGAAVCWRAALNHPEFIEKLVIMNVPHPGAFNHLIKSNWRQFINSWYVFMFQVPYLPELMLSAEDYKTIGNMFRGKTSGLRLHPANFTEEDLAAWLHVFSQEGALSPPVNFYRASIRFPAPTTLKDIVKPDTLIIWGSEDPFLVKEGAELSVQGCNNGRVAYVEGASHWVQQDAPEEVNKLMEDFLRQ